MPGSPRETGGFDADLVLRQVSATDATDATPARAAEIAAELDRLEQAMRAEREAGPDLLGDPALFRAVLERRRDDWPDPSA